MIYITYKSSIFDDSLAVNNVWNVNCNNAKELYFKFMQEKAKDINVVINPHWLNVLNQENHNNHLSISEYKKKVNEWNKVKMNWSFDKYISEILKGTKENYKNIIL